MSYAELEAYLRSTESEDGTPIVAVERVKTVRLDSVLEAVGAILTRSPADRLLRQWRQQRVLLKPNFCRVGRQGETTSLLAIKALLAVLSDNQCDIILGDGMTQSHLPPRNPDGFRQVASRLVDTTRRYGVPFVHIDEPRESRIRVEADGATFYLPGFLNDVAGLVNLPVLKVHPQMVGSFAVKNHMGLVSGADRLLMHRAGIAESIWRLQACLAKIVPQQVHLVDGLVSFQGYDAPTDSTGPGLFIGGINPCAVDLVCAQLMGIDAEHDFPQHAVAITNGFAYGPHRPVRWRGPALEELRFPCHMPDRVAGPPPSLPSVRIIWGGFSYPMNQAVKDLLRHMDKDLPLDIYVGGAAPRVDADGRWSVCLGNASIANYRGGCRRVIVIPGDPPAGVEFAQHLRRIAASISANP